MRLLIGLVSYLLFCVAWPFLFFHPKLRAGYRERFGLGPRLPKGSGPRIWAHGASAGDVLALVPTLKALKAARPDVEIVLSTITNSGRAMAERQHGLVNVVTYLPYDIPFAVRGALKRLAPDMLVLEYTEIWPQLILNAHDRGVRLVLHNGRFSDARINSYRRLFAFTGNLLRRFTLLLMRDDQQAENARKLGVDEHVMQTTGNTKFDNVMPDPPAEKIAELRAAIAFPDDAPIWVAGSTHEDEEEILIGVFTRLRATLPNLRMVIAPRYVERADRVLAIAKAAGLKGKRRSHEGSGRDLVVLDTIGELAACYALATLVFVGGSFVRRGGQNILEPAAAGKPTIFGPFMHNFADSVQVLLGRGGIQVASPDQLERVLKDLLEREPRRRELGELARAQALSSRGAAQRNAELIAAVL
ncbi:MAG: 3-deoxy-D-manno-octulosonic acid transferase [Myxococcota bacterium]